MVEFTLQGIHILEFQAAAEFGLTCSHDVVAPSSMHIHRAAAMHAVVRPPLRSRELSHQQQGQQI